MDEKAILNDGDFLNKLFWEVVPNNAWAGKPCYIIAGGPSLQTQWPWLIPRLKGRLTIGINRTYEVFDPTIIFGMDPTFIRWVQMGKYGEPAKKLWDESKAYKVWLCTYKTQLADDIYVLKCFGGYNKALRSFPASMKQGIGHGQNSGYAALNLAGCLGANPIYLLGFDMYREGERTHWHTGHPKPMPDHVPETFKKHFIVAAKALEKRGIKCINLNPKSGLPYFPKAEMTTAFVTSPTQPIVSLTREGAKFGPVEKLAPKPAPKPKRLSDLSIIGPYGYGDNFFLRSLVKGLAEKYRNIYVRTPIPEVFWDINNVRCARLEPNKLRTQAEHIKYIDKCSEYEWEEPPEKTETKKWGDFLPGWKHGSDAPDAKAVTINPRGEESPTEYFVNENELKHFDFSFPVKQTWLEEAKKIIKGLDTKGKKICIVRPLVIHKGWACYTRNPELHYIQLLVDKYKDEYFFVTLSNNKRGDEWFEDGELKGIDKRYDHGELFITTVFALVKLADMVITPPDVFSMLAIAMRTKCFCIFGGCAKPSVVFNENMGMENFEYVAPEPFCNCMRMRHDCKKKIPEEQIIKKFEALKARPKYINKISVGLPPGIGDMHWVLNKLNSFKQKNCIDELEVVIDRSPALNYSREFLKLVPFIDSVDDHPRRLPFRFVIAAGDGIPLQRDINNIDYLIEFNSRLEQGVRIEDILPEYEVDFDYPINNPREARSFASLIKSGTGGKLYIFYASSEGGNRNWCKGAWEPEDWVGLANMIYNATKQRTLLLGAEWDSGYAKIVKDADKRNRIQDFTGKTTISEAIALLREANFMVAFLSGLVPLATRFKVPCVSFWPTLKQAPHWINPPKFQCSWIPPNAKGNGYMPFNYGEKNTNPNGVFNAIRKYL